ncbi:replication protein [Moellerella wisconsensis]|uniref:Replication protein n=1 Tax=Moellerella wisconsensis TaxID=158849 RepID=A0A9Q8V3C7_9GAMM|nr:replication protein [Moellerella wisconsensis]UNH30092.1 replication protein [Moellerella wisconsensis]
MNVVKHVDFANRQLIPDKPEVKVADLSNGYTKTANDIQMLKPRLRMSGREWQCFEAVIWLTYGWNKKQDRVTNTVIAELTGLEDTHVSNAIKALAERKIIFSRKQGVMKIVGVNTDLKAWELEKPRTVRKLPKTVKSLPKTVKVLPETVDTQYKNKNSINNLTSENSNESSDRPSEKVLAVKPDAVVSTPKGDKWGNADDLTTAKWIYKRVLIISPTAKEPAWPSWANDVRLMRQLDGRTHEQICALFSWANKDSFWCSNVLSPAKLREKWPQLEAKRNTQQPSRSQAAGKHIDFDNTDWAEGLEV